MITTKNRSTDPLQDFQQWSACAFKNWYHKFRKISTPARYLVMPAEIRAYLLDDSIILPKECGHLGNGGGGGGDSSPTAWYDTSSGYEDEDTADYIVQPEFPAFSAEIATAIEAVGGAAFVKTNWHCPKDAFWITAGQTLRCTDITDVYQLCKASVLCRGDIDYHGLSLAGQIGIDTSQYLVLKKWQNINPCTEFRCYVRHHQLIGERVGGSLCVCVHITFVSFSMRWRSNFTARLATVPCVHQERTDRHYIGHSFAVP